MARRVIGIDLGAYSVKIVRLLVGKQEPKYEIIGTVEEVVSLQEVEGEDEAQRQKNALIACFNNNNIEGELYVTGLSPYFANMRRMDVPFIDTRKVEQVLPGLLESEVPFDLDEMIVAWYPNPSVPAVDEKTEPRYSISLAFGRKDAIQQQLDQCQSVNVDPKYMVLSSQAPFEIVREKGTNAFFKELPEGTSKCGAFIDFGHTATNITIIDEKGLVISKSILKGGKGLTEEIAKVLEVEPSEAVALKHAFTLEAADTDQKAQTIKSIVERYYQKIFLEIERFLIACRTDNLASVSGLVLLGGSAKMQGFTNLVAAYFKDLAVRRFDDLALEPSIGPQFAVAFSYALVGLSPHSRESRFNFRKDEFVYRGGLDFVKARSSELTLWGLILFCALALVYFASSSVLDKENKVVEGKLKAACEAILGKKDIPPQKCLALMKAETSVNQGIPEYTASDFYVDAAKLPASLNVTFTELEVDTKVRIIAETDGFEKVDEIVAGLSKMPCLRKVEKQGRTTQLDKGGVRFQLSAEIDCKGTNSAAQQAASKTPLDNKTEATTLSVKG